MKRPFLDIWCVLNPSAPFTCILSTPWPQNSDTKTLQFRGSTNSIPWSLDWIPQPSALPHFSLFSSR